MWGSAPTRCRASPCFALAIQMCSFPLLCYPFQFRCASKQFVSYLIQFNSTLRLTNSGPIYTIPHRFCSKPFRSSAALFCASPFPFRSTLFRFDSQLYSSISGPVYSASSRVYDFPFLREASLLFAIPCHFRTNPCHFTSQLIFSNAPLCNSFSFLGLSNPLRSFSTLFPITTARSYSSSSRRLISSPLVSIPSRSKSVLFFSSAFHIAAIPMPFSSGLIRIELYRLWDRRYGKIRTDHRAYTRRFLPA